MIEQQPRPEWSRLPRPGCENVSARVLLHKDGVTVANLRFEPKATIDRHAAPFEIDVICVGGSGYTSIGEQIFEIAQGQTIRWPAGDLHCLWTDGDALETIMIERHGV